MDTCGEFEPGLASELYEHILSVIRAAGRAMSCAPNWLSARRTEDRRQELLLMLSSHYAPAGPTQRRSPLRVGPTCSFAWRIAISSLPNA